MAQIKANDTLIKSMNDNKEDMKKISNNIDSAENKNPAQDPGPEILRDRS